MNPADGTRSALLVASSDYQDPGLRRLRAPGSDAEALGAVLRDAEIGAFEVRTLLNQPAHEINLAVEEFFADRRPDDLLLVHFSCHGIKDESGELYFAAANTRLDRLGATAVAAEFVNRRMGRSRSRRVVLLLDCCYAGAFERGMMARADPGMAIEEQFGGRGRAVITASSAMEYAFEGGQLAEAHQLGPSVFTNALVEGLRTGDADRDQDGHVGLDELYDYVYDKVRAATPKQTPGKWTFGVQGELHIARRSQAVSVPTPLPPELRQAVDSPFAGVRAGAVPELERLLRSGHAGRVLAARLTLERLAEDDSRMVGAAATAALGAQARPAPPVEVPPTCEPQPARPAPTEAKRTERSLQLAGLLAMVSAVLLVAGLFPPYRFETLEESWDGVIGYVLITAALALVVGAGTLMPGTRRVVDPGLLLGVVAASTWGLVALAGDWVDMEGEYFESAFWLVLTAHLTLVAAACLAGLAVARTVEVRLALLPKGPVAWLVALLGVAGSVTLLVQDQAQIIGWGKHPAPFVWAAVLALVVPVGAAVVTPRRFGAGLLVGWIGGGAALFVYAFLALDRGYFPFGLTLLALVVVAVPFARRSGETAN